MHLRSLTNRGTMAEWQAGLFYCPLRLGLRALFRLRVLRSGPWHIGSWPQLQNCREHFIFVRDASFASWFWHKLIIPYGNFFKRSEQLGILSRRSSLTSSGQGIARQALPVFVSKAPSPLPIGRKRCTGIFWPVQPVSRMATRKSGKNWPLSFLPGRSSQLELFMES